MYLDEGFSSIDNLMSARRFRQFRWPGRGVNTLQLTGKAPKYISTIKEAQKLCTSSMTSWKKFVSFFSGMEGGALQFHVNQSGWSISMWETIFPSQLDPIG